MSASQTPTAQPPSLPGWIWVVLLPTSAAPCLLGMDPQGFLPSVLPWPPLVLSGWALALLLVFMALRGWWHRRRLFQRYPNEPWRWDRPWRKVLIDGNLSELITRLPLLLALAVPLAIVHVIFFFVVTTASGAGWIPALLFGGFLLACDVFALALNRLFWRRVLALHRFGRVRLRLPRVPLSLGSRYQVHLVARRGLTQLTQVRAELRRVREWRQKTDTRRETEYTNTQSVDASALREGQDLAIRLELPSQGGAQHSTVLNGSHRLLWELQLTSEVPGVDLDATFVLPVYYALQE